MGANVSYPDKQGSSGSRGSGYYGFNVHAKDGAENVVAREKKKKTSKFATLRKKLNRVRRHSRSYDHAKAIREFTSNWSIRELHALVEEYEASIALKELTILSNLARPSANSLKQDLSNLYDYKFCTDLDLIYRGACFPVHRAILSARCPYFRHLLRRFPTYGAQVPVDIKTHGVDVNLFSALLRYLYTGEFNQEESHYENLDILVQIGEEFGTPNLLEHDLRRLLETGEYCDTVLLFSSDGDHHPDPVLSDCTDACGDACSPPHVGRLELHCHKALLAARSPFFRSLLMRRARAGEHIAEHILRTPTRIILDESVIPRKYARVLLNAIYLDTVDLSCILKSSVSACSLSEVQAMVSGKGNMTPADEAMEIFQIGQFLDFPVLSQGCEDIIVDNLCVENLPSTLAWSQEPHGSDWVHRQTFHYLREEFTQVAHSQMLQELSKEYLIAAIQSDYLQASEAEVLCAVIKWGEHQLMKRMEEREPNILSHTAHSVSKKGIKKRDLSDTELRDILECLLPYVRTNHIIPHNHDVFTSSIKRGLISVPPTHMLGDHEEKSNRVNSWVQGKNNGMYVKPRLFQPYYEEVKALLEEQLSQVTDSDVIRLRTVHMSSIPDTLYMVDDPQTNQPFIPSTATVDIIAGTILVPDQETIQAMLRRESELHRTKLVHRAYALPCSDRRGISHQVQLRVVREFGLPDSTIELFQTGQLYSSDNEHNKEGRRKRISPPSGVRPRVNQQRMFRRSPPTPVSPPRPARLFREVPPLPPTYGPCPPSPADAYSPVEKESVCSESALSDTMPDIAMATGGMSAFSLQDMPSNNSPDNLELDLGDGGGSHQGGMMYI
ncbi:BTB/POZ domain-containing protein 7-like [Tubulanus polymorphus]|uniref:BTB/POZ domain-containing protein 7-like n=1 Tax=Tubulanus polymorphus TaxID=672921 RepID=UPI003DA64B71